MSLVISLDGAIGDYYSRQGIANVNNTLKRIGVLNHELTPMLIPKNTTIPYLNLKCYDIECLQFVAAQLKENPRWKPSSCFTSQSIHPDLKMKFVLENKSHLICHSSIFGCFVPVKFGNLLLPPELLIVFGSSFNLCNELKEIAGRLNFDLGKYNPNFEVLFEQRFNELEDDPIASEKLSMLYMYNMCLGSIKHQLIISFSG
jgi:hypothetical protein